MPMDICDDLMRLCKPVCSPAAMRT